MKKEQQDKLNKGLKGKFKSKRPLLARCSCEALKRAKAKENTVETPIDSAEAKDREDGWHQRAASRGKAAVRSPLSAY